MTQPAEGISIVVEAACCGMPLLVAGGTPTEGRLCPEHAPELYPWLPAHEKGRAT